MSRTKDDLINYRIERAYATLNSAKRLTAFDDWNTIANRLYYASFYAVLALLAKNDIDTYTHTKVSSPC